MPPSPSLEPQDHRLIVVSNRLPVTIKKDASGKYTYKMSSGGLVSALSGCKKTMQFTWIGWPGQDVSFLFHLFKSNREKSGLFAFWRAR